MEELPYKPFSVTFLHDFPSLIDSTIRMADIELSSSSSLPKTGRHLKKNLFIENGSLKIAVE